MITMARKTPPKAPAHLKKAGKKLWTNSVRDYDFADHELILLRLACESLDRSDEARDVLNAEGLTIGGGKGVVKSHPCNAVERDAKVSVSRLLRELNMSDEVEADARPPRISNRYKRT